MQMITEIEDQFGRTVSVMKDDDNRYSVFVDDINRHPNGTAEDVIRALSHYLHNACYQLVKLQNQKG